MIEPQNPAMRANECYQQCFLSDNMELMKTIESNTIDLIYCDILYGTGRKFKDYQDLKPIRNDIENHYIPRLKEMHRILKPTGSIYLQMDTKINHWVRCIMDDIFGYERMLNEKVWCYSTSGSNKNKWGEKHDVILYYSKTKKRTWNIYMDTKISQCMKNRTLSINTQNGRLIDEKWMVDVYPKDWVELNNIQRNNKEYTGYNTQKPKALLERIIKASSNENDLVADFYAGSFTTAEVCKDLNRNFIGCDINQKCIDISKQRLI
jgi:site-specific DNA-methyltransferase (adenine-specific)